MTLPDEWLAPQSTGLSEPTTALGVFSANCENPPFPYDSRFRSQKRWRSVRRFPSVIADRSVVHRNHAEIFAQCAIGPEHRMRAGTVTMAGRRVPVERPRPSRSDRRGSIPLGADRKASNRIPKGALSRTLHCGQRPAGLNATRPVADGVTG